MIAELLKRAREAAERNWVRLHLVVSLYQLHRRFGRSRLRSLGVSLWQGLEGDSQL